MRQHIAILIAVCSLGVLGCERAKVIGSGVAATEVRNVGDFDEVEFFGTGRMEIAVGSLGPLEITADDNILPQLRTEISDRRLTIRPVGRIRPKVDILVKVTVPNLKLVTCAGNPTVTLADIENDTLAIEIMGNGSVRANGTTGELAINITGNGNVETTDLAARTVDVTITGNGNVLTQASDTLTVSITGAGSVRYGGNPKIQKTVIGAGIIAKQ